MHRSRRSRKRPARSFVPKPISRFIVSAFQANAWIVKREKPQASAGFCNCKPAAQKKRPELFSSGRPAALPQNCQTTKWIVGAPRRAVNVTLVTRSSPAVTTGMVAQLCDVQPRKIELKLFGSHVTAAHLGEHARLDCVGLFSIMEAGDVCTAVHFGKAWPRAELVDRYFLCQLPPPSLVIQIS